MFVCVCVCVCRSEGQIGKVNEGSCSSGCCLRSNGALKRLSEHTGGVCSAHWQHKSFFSPAYDCRGAQAVDGGGDFKK